MSRIGSKPVAIPEGVTVGITESEIQVKGKDATLTIPRLDGIKIEEKDKEKIKKQIKFIKKLESFGFRGEALASVSAVSNFEIVSKSAEKEAKAYRYSTQFGCEGRLLETSRATGTTVNVRDLFENVPARKKFLKSDSAETSLVKKTVKALAKRIKKTSPVL